MVWIWQMEILWCMFVIPMGGSWYNSGCITSATYVATQGQFSWNEDVITIRIAIRLLLGGLIVAFVFTLAFRGVLGIRNCYWGAALAVHAIVAYRIVKVLPFVAIQLL